MSRPERVSTRRENAIVYVADSPIVLELNPGDHVATPWPAHYYGEKEVDAFVAEAEAVVPGWPPPWGESSKPFHRASVAADEARVPWISEVDNNFDPPGQAGWRKPEKP